MSNFIHCVCDISTNTAINILQSFLMATVSACDGVGMATVSAYCACILWIHLIHTTRTAHLDKFGCTTRTAHLYTFWMHHSHRTSGYILSLAVYNC